MVGCQRAPGGGVAVDVRRTAFSHVPGTVRSLLVNWRWEAEAFNAAGRQIWRDAKTYVDTEVGTIRQVFNPGYSVDRAEIERFGGELRRFAQTNARPVARNTVLEMGLLTTAIWLASLAASDRHLARQDFQSGRAAALATA